MSERFVELIKEDPGASFGFNIKGGIDVGCPVYIWRVEPGTIADRQGIKSGDEILNANGIDFRNIHHTDALKVLKSAGHLNLVMRTTQPTAAAALNAGDFRGEFYTWVDKFGNPVPPPKESEILRAPTRLVDLQIDPGQNLGLMIRGGCEYGLGIYVTGVDPGSVAERVGLQRGDEILQVNSRPFTNVTHDKAVQTLKSCRKMTLTVAHVGKIPADLTYEVGGGDKDCSDVDFDPNCTTGDLISMNHNISSIMNDHHNLHHHSHNHDVKSTSVLQMIEEKARTVLTKSEHSRFTFYRLEYSQGFLPICTFVRILLELLSTHEKYTLLTEVREIIRSEDRAQFDELIYKPAGLIGLNKNDPNINVPFQQGGGGDPNNQVGTNKALVNSNNPSGIPGIMDNFADNVHNGGDLIYLRELRGNNPGNTNGQHLGGTNDRVPNDCMPPISKGDQQMLMSAGGGGPGGGSQNSPAVRFRVRCQKIKPTLGITIEGGLNTPHRLARIINISPDGSAAVSNLKPGQVLLSVDGKKLDGLTHEEIARLISSSYNDSSKHMIDFIVVENKSNLVVLGNSGATMAGGGGGGLGLGLGGGCGPGSGSGSDRSGSSPLPPPPSIMGPGGINMGGGIPSSASSGNALTMVSSAGGPGSGGGMMVSAGGPMGRISPGGLA